VGYSKSFSKGVIEMTTLPKEKPVKFVEAEMNLFIVRYWISDDHSDNHKQLLEKIEKPHGENARKII
jgi:hypothetical protein